MPKLAPLAFDAFVVAAAFVEGRPVFALGDGTLHAVDADGAMRSAVAHDGGILAAVMGADGRRLVTSGDDGRVVSTGADLAPELHEPGLVWGAAKAHVVLARRRP